MLTRDEIIKIAELSRLELSESEIEKYQTELSGILDFFEMLKEVNTEGVEPTAQVTGLENILRIDEVQTFSEGNLLGCSPLPKSNNQVAVPAVF